jgi:hypothetical protein
MSVRAKFKCLGINHLPTQSSAVRAEIRLIPVWEQDGVNRKWSEATPAGEIKMLITNPAAIEAFELDKSYFVDFTPADA